MEIQNRSREYFKQVANQWDDLRSAFFTENIRKIAIKKSYLRPEMTVVDMGGGTGYMTAGLASLVREVHLVDNSPEMLAVAAKNLASFGNIQFHQIDGDSITLQNESVDAVFANMYLHHCTDPAQSIREMARILRPGGRLMITDLDQHDHSWMKEEMADVWMGFEHNQINEWYQEAGLVNIIVDSTDEKCCADSDKKDSTDDSVQKAKINVFFATGTKRLSMRSDVETAYGKAVEKGSCCSGSSTSEKASCCGDAPVQSSSCCVGETKTSSSCCSNDAYIPVQSVVYETDYSIEEKQSVPGEAVQISLGCGNPIAIANLKPGETVLDIGSGGGMDSFLAAKRVGETGKVIGVDMTIPMLERARLTAARSGIRNVDFRYGLAEEIPVDSSTIDVVLSNCVINLCEDKGRVFEEAFRVLKPGGRIEISDMVTAGPLPASTRDDSNEWAGCVSGALPEQEYIDLVCQAGFEQIKAIRSSSVGDAAGVPVYSISLSANKPIIRDGKSSSTISSGCNCKSDNCCG